MKRCVQCSATFSTPDWKCPSCGQTPATNGTIVSLAPEIAREGAHFDAVFFPTMVEIEETNFWFRARKRLAQWAFKKYFSEARNLLDIGCGTGFMLRALRASNPSLTLTGSEAFIAPLEQASSRLAGIQLLQMDARNIPFEHEFDVISAFDVLEHIEDDVKVLDQMFRAVKPGGGVIITVPQHPWLWSTNDDFVHHVRRYTRPELVRKLRGSGFAIARATSFVSLALPAMIASRLKNKRIETSEYKLEAEHVGGFANALLNVSMDLELAGISHGVDFPAGGSLLIVARRP